MGLAPGGDFSRKWHPFGHVVHGAVSSGTTVSLSDETLQEVNGTRIEDTDIYTPESPVKTVLERPLQ
jgi:hypothetical protein